MLRIAGGLTINGGAIRLTGDATTLAFEGTQTWSTGSVFFEGATGGRRIIEAVNGGTTLTLGASFTVHGSGDLGGSRAFGNNFTLINGGTIQADVSGQSLNIPSRVTLTNVTATGKLRSDTGGILNSNAVTTAGSGVIDVSGGELNLGGTVTPEVFTNFTRTGGTVNLLGVLTNTGNTFTFNATTGTWNLLGGTVAGGTIAFADGQTLAISTNFNNRLTGVTITGDLVMNMANAVLRISGGLTVNGGAIRLTR